MSLPPGGAVAGLVVRSTVAGLVAGLALIVESFGREVVWLWRRSRRRRREPL